jgi:hypothetical protein
LPASVQIIGSDFTRRMLIGPEAPSGCHVQEFHRSDSRRIENSAQTDRSRTDAQKKATLEGQLASQEAT